MVKQINTVNGPFTTGFVSRLYRVAPRTVSKWVDTGHLGGTRLPGSMDRRISLEDLKQFALANPKFDHPEWLVPKRDDSEVYNDGWIQTFTGRKFYFLRCTPDDICLHDISRALSHLCRFTGHTKYHYSVAQHSESVSGYFPQNPLLGIMHDAVEAYINDMSRPLKHLGNHGLYKKVNDHIEAMIYEKFDIKIKGSDLEDLKVVDTRMLVTEARDVLPQGPHKDWTIDMVKYPAYGERIVQMDCDTAMAMFEAQYYAIIDGRF